MDDEINALFLLPLCVGAALWMTGGTTWASDETSENK